MEEEAVSLATVNQRCGQTKSSEMEAWKDCLFLAGATAASLLSSAWEKGVFAGLCLSSGLLQQQRETFA